MSDPPPYLEHLLLLACAAHLLSALSCEDESGTAYPLRLSAFETADYCDSFSSCGACTVEPSCHWCPTDGKCKPTIDTTCGTDIIPQGSCCPECEQKRRSYHSCVNTPGTIRASDPRLACHAATSADVTCLIPILPGCGWCGTNIIADGNNECLSGTPNAVCRKEGRPHDGCGQYTIAG